MGQQKINRELRAADRPIAHRDHDAFQRAPFAERIANILLHRQSRPSIVVGLYGKWGEGKSSVLELIKRSLELHSDKVAIVEFNPWHFPNESQLLISFFGDLARSIGQSKKFNPLSEKTAEVIAKYIGPMIPNMNYGTASTEPGKSVSAIAELFLPNIAELRTRIEGLISRSGKQVVVIIDDIDRLEKQQIQAIFRLVKLVANFTSTSYLLAFDHLMVAKSIGEMFEQGGEAAGQNFLEKIIQVPLNLPRAHPDALMRYLHERVDEVLSETNTSLTKQERDRFDNAIAYGVLPYLSTPRLAIRYANAIHFALPLLEGEANAVDVLLVEALKVFYPELHAQVAESKHIVAGGVTPRSLGLNQDETQKTAIKSAFEASLNSYGIGQQAAQSLLGSLFPQVRRAFHSGPWFSGFNELNRALEEDLDACQAVASRHYFDRYFTYAVIEGQLPDRDFFQFLNLITQNPKEAIPFASELIINFGSHQLLNKTNNLLNSIKQEAVRTLVGILAKLISEELTSQVAKLCKALISLLPSSDLRTECSINAIQQAKTPFFGIELIRVIQEGRHDDSPVEATSLIDHPQFRRLASTLLNRVLGEAQGAPIYRTHPDLAAYILIRGWRISTGSTKTAIDYLKTHFIKSPKDFPELLVAIFGSNLILRDDVRSLAQNLGGPFLYGAARAAFGSEPITENPGSWDVPSTPESLLRQFIYLYEHFVLQNEESSQK